MRRQLAINLLAVLMASLIDVGGELINFCFVFIINYQEIISVKLPAVSQAAVPFIKFSYEISIPPVRAASYNRTDKN